MKYLYLKTFIFIDITLSLQNKKMIKRISKYSKYYQLIFKIFCAFKNRS